VGTERENAIDHGRRRIDEIHLKRPSEQWTDESFTLSPRINSESDI
jgi:hypothetical protein